MKKDATLSMCFNTREEVALTDVWAAHFLHPLSVNFNRYIKYEKAVEYMHRYMGSYGSMEAVWNINAALYRFAQQCEYIDDFNPIDKGGRKPCTHWNRGRIERKNKGWHLYVKTDPEVFAIVANQLQSKARYAHVPSKDADESPRYWYRDEIALLQVFAAHFLHPLAGHLDRRIPMSQVMAELHAYCGEYKSLVNPLYVLQALYDYAHQCEYVADFNPLEMCRHMPTTRRAFGIIEDKEGEWYLYVKTDLVVFPLVAEQLATKKWRY